MDKYRIDDGKVYNDNGDVAVLVSSGYGMGWSTCYTDIPIILYYPPLVMFLLDSYTTVTDLYLCDGNYFYPHRYSEKGRHIFKDINSILTFAEDEIKKLAVRWIPKGSHYRITEYDGAEGVEILDVNKWKYNK
jgi:hypothetical protein